MPYRSAKASRGHSDGFDQPFRGTDRLDVTQSGADDGSRRQAAAVAAAVLTAVWVVIPRWYANNRPLRPTADDTATIVQMTCGMPNHTPSREEVLLDPLD